MVARTRNNPGCGMTQADDAVARVGDDRGQLDVSGPFRGRPKRPSLTATRPRCKGASPLSASPQPAPQAKPSNSRASSNLQPDIGLRTNRHQPAGQTSITSWKAPSSRPAVVVCQPPAHSQ